MGTLGSPELKNSLRYHQYGDKIIEFSLMKNWAC